MITHLNWVAELRDFRRGDFTQISQTSHVDFTDPVKLENEMKLTRTMVKPTPYSTAFVALILALLLSGSANAVDENPDRCLAPYFVIQSEESSLEDFPLRRTHTQVSIAGVIAEVKVTQVYANTGSGTIEAVYLFPASTRAAVHGMEMKIGERMIKAEIQEKHKARRTYTEAKKEKKSAALLEQKRPNVFQMNVANIHPGDEVEVTLHYSETLRPDTGIYEFVYPTVVGPRYTDRRSASPDAPDHSWVQNPHVKEGESVPSAFEFDLALQAGMPIQSLKCASHPADIRFTGKDGATLQVSGDEAANRDVIVRYQLSDKEIASGLLLHKGAEENFFLLNVQPPERVRPEHIPPREYIFVVDVSGSMAGFPLKLAGDLFGDLIGGLRSEDSFNILAFAGSSDVFSAKSVPATKKNVQAGLGFLEGHRGGGGTKLVHALRRATRLPGSNQKSRSILVITDGFISMEADAFDLVRKELGKANLFAFGIGSSVNRHLIEGLARVGLGEPFVVTAPSEAKPVAKKLRDYISAPVLTNIQIEATGIDIHETEPGSIPDVFAARPLTLTGKWKGEPGGTIRITGLTGNGQKLARQFEFSEAAKAGTKNPALRALWARERVRSLIDYAGRSADEEAILEVTNLGLTYSLMTPYTSFVAVDERVRDYEDRSETVHQPSPLPQGVSNSAVGGSVPEPSAALLLLLSLFAVGFTRNRSSK